MRCQALTKRASTEPPTHQRRISGTATIGQDMQARDRQYNILHMPAICYCSLRNECRILQNPLSQCRGAWFRHYRFFLRDTSMVRSSLPGMHYIW